MYRQVYNEQVVKVYSLEVHQTLNSDILGVIVDSFEE